MGKIGQFRSFQLNSYSIPSTFFTNKIKTTLENTNITFKDPCINLFGEYVLNSEDCYYLKIKVKQNDNVQNFSVKLLNTSLSKDNEQYLEEFNVPVGTAFSYYELVFQPNSIYDTIVFELKRNSLDHEIMNLDGTSGRVLIIDTINLEKLINVIDFLKNSYNELEYLTKIGVQGPTALLMCINGEQIRIGKNKIYEINNNYKINFISFISNNDYFIMDFEY